MPGLSCHTDSRGEGGAFNFRFPTSVTLSHWATVCKPRLARCSGDLRLPILLILRTGGQRPPLQFEVFTPTPREEGT
jgi:hypothetical protein